MSALVVLAHPDPESLTHHVARRIRSALGSVVVEVADLAVEGFDPRFTAADRDTYLTGSDAPADVLREQQRIERATDLILVFPVYWWSMPAVLKGWIDRVFINGWAFQETPDGMQRNLDWLSIHLVPIAAENEGVYDRHGYERSLSTQIEHGIIDYCGGRRGVTVYVYDSEAADPSARERSIQGAVASVAEAVSSPAGAHGEQVVVGEE